VNKHGPTPSGSGTKTCWLLFLTAAGWHLLAVPSWFLLPPPCGGPDAELLQRYPLMSGSTYLPVSCSTRRSTGLRSAPDRSCRCPGRWACAERRRASWGWTRTADPRGEWSLVGADEGRGWEVRFAPTPIPSGTSNHFTGDGCNSQNLIRAGWPTWWGDCGSVVCRSVFQSGGWQFNPRPSWCVLEQNT